MKHTRRSSPWVPLYTDDFVSGTVDMTAEEIGCYLLLLCFQQQRQTIPSAPDTLRRICRMDLDRWEKVSAAVLRKFVRDEDGNLYNVRMRAEMEHRETIRELRSKVGAKGGRPSKEEANQKQMVLQIESNDKPTTATTTTIQEEQIRGREAPVSEAQAEAAVPTLGGRWWHTRNRSGWRIPGSGYLVTPETWRSDLEAWASTVRANSAGHNNRTGKPKKCLDEVQKLKGNDW